MDREQWIAHEEEIAGGAEWATCVQGPSVAIVGWIPRVEGAESIGSHELGQAWESRLDVRSLFGSTGNGEPNQQYLGPGKFQEDLGLCDFRGAIGINEPQVYLDRHGKACRLTFWRMARVGYTPFRVHNVTYRARGTKRASVQVDCTEDSVRIRLWIKVKIGWLGNIGAWMLTGHRAPWAQIMIDYRISATGLVQVECFGTRLPSQTVYVDWNKEHVYRAEYCSLRSFDEFVQSGQCQDAPIFRIYRPMRMGRVVWRKDV